MDEFSYRHPSRIVGLGLPCTVMGKLIDALYELQQQQGYLSEEQLREFAHRENVPLYRLQELVSFYPHFQSTPPKRVQLSVCRDVACHMAVSDDHREALRALADADPEVQLQEVSCLGRCEIAPAAAIGDCPVPAGDLAALSDQIASPPSLNEAKRSPRSWQCDPYRDGAAHYGTLRACLDGGFDANRVVQTLKDSGLRGMGGAGFPTGMKWDMVSKQPAGEKYVVCNADESEPGTFKDRVILAELPHLIIEGMVLAGGVVGAEQGIIFIRHEYAPERELLQAAIEQARAKGVIGNDVLGSGKRFELNISVSPGGYILGEETALLECLEDKRGEPRNKPPYPGEHGLWQRPTLINNVETFALVPRIVSGGAEAWKALGQRGCAGLKFISVSGDVVTPDVYEIPMGTTIAELIAMAGGVIDDKQVLAVAPGGASSNFIAGDQCDLPLDFDALKQAGTMLGSGALFVVAEGRDIVKLAINIVSFFRNESCGKCVPCRVGSEKAVTILENALAGHGKQTHLPLLNDLRDTMEQTSICGLGQVVLNPFTSVRDAFPDTVNALFDKE